MLRYDYEQVTLFTSLQRSDWSVETAERSQSKVHKVDSTVLMILFLNSRSEGFHCSREAGGWPRLPADIRLRTQR